jgi:hypothetical protein
MWHPGLHCKLSELEFSANLIKVIVSFLSNRKFKVSVEGRFSMPRETVAGVPQGSVLAPVLYSLYTNYAPMALRINLALFMDDTYICICVCVCVCETEKHELCVVSITTWPHCCEVLV